MRSPKVMRAQTGNTTFLLYGHNDIFIGYLPLLIFNEVMNHLIKVIYKYQSLQNVDILSDIKILMSREAGAVFEISKQKRKFSWSRLSKKMNCQERPVRKARRFLTFYKCNCTIVCFITLNTINVQLLMSFLSSYNC